MARLRSPLPRSATNLPFPEVIDPEAPRIRTERLVADPIATTRSWLSVALVRALRPISSLQRAPQTADPPI
jgi:hypothetical protein